MIRKTIVLMGLLAAAQTAMAIEQPEYEVLAATEAYEIRRYAPYIVAEVDVQGPMDGAGNEAFRILAAYIFGNNVPGEKMNMTAPVESREARGRKMNMTAPVESRPTGEDEYTYSFVMERKYTLDTLPKPVDRRIRITTNPERTMAVRKYSGGWGKSKYDEHTGALLAALEGAGIDIVGVPVWARYDSPFKPWFLRRNEIMVEIDLGKQAMSALPD